MEERSAQKPVQVYPSARLHVRIHCSLGHRHTFCTCTHRSCPSPCACPVGSNWILLHVCDEAALPLRSRRDSQPMSEGNERTQKLKVEVKTVMARSSHGSCHGDTWLGPGRSHPFDLKMSLTWLLMLMSKLCASCLTFRLRERAN